MNFRKDNPELGFWTSFWEQGEVRDK